MLTKLKSVRETAAAAIKNAGDLAVLEQIRIDYLGKKSELSGIMKQMGGLSPEERKEVGALANIVRGEIEMEIEALKASLGAKAVAKRMEEEKIDVTASGTMPARGKKHPLTKVLDEMKEIFIGMGFTIEEGPEIETDYYNFEALNMPKEHPSRDTQDTFYITENLVLRTQTSPVQARTMDTQELPIRIIAPGTVYRSDAVDATHSPVFHQVEGLVVDKNITMTDLKGTLETFAKRLYGDDAAVRFRPHNFSFTEPSAEMDIMCFNCHGEGCSLCKGEGYIEILGAGMVHPNVLRNCGIDPDIYSGFAFGMGVERIVMRKYKIDDLRLLFENDVRFLNQF